MLTDYQMLQGKIERLSLNLEAYKSPTGYIIAQSVSSRKLNVLCRGDYFECMDYLTAVYFRSQGL